MGCFYFGEPLMLEPPRRDYFLLGSQTKKTLWTVKALLLYIFYCNHTAAARGCGDWFIILHIQSNTSRLVF